MPTAASPKIKDEIKISLEIIKWKQLLGDSARKKQYHEFSNPGKVILLINGKARRNEQQRKRVKTWKIVNELP